MIDRSLERIKGMRNLILDMLDLTRIESGKKVRNIQNVDICEIAQVSIDTNEPMAIQKNVRIHKNFPENAYYQADSSEIEIVFNNLISNAVNTTMTMEK